MSANAPSPTPAPAAPIGAPAPAPAPAASPANGAPPAEMPAWFGDALKSATAPLVKSISDLQAQLGQAAEEKEAAHKAATTAAAEKVTIEQQLASLRDEWKRDKASAALESAARQIQYASPQHAANALAVFRGAHRIEVREGGEVVAIGADGKGAPLGAAFNAFATGPAGAMFRASVAQPGAGAPASLPIEGAAQKLPAEMSREEYAAFKERGFTGRLTNNPHSPVITYKTAADPHAARRSEMLAQATGRTSALKAK